MDIEASKDKHIKELIKRTSSMLDEIESKIKHKDKGYQQKKKKLDTE